MASITLKNIPTGIYERLKESAARNHRSLNREAIACLERALEGERLDVEAFLSRARALRARFRGAAVADDEVAGARGAGRP